MCGFSFKTKGKNEMTLDDVNVIVDKINDIRERLSKVRMDLEVGWIKMALQELETFEDELRQFQRDIVLRKTIQVINSSPEGVYVDE